MHDLIGSFIGKAFTVKPITDGGIGLLRSRIYSAHTAALHILYTRFANKFPGTHIFMGKYRLVNALVLRSARVIKIRQQLPPDITKRYAAIGIE